MNTLGNFVLYEKALNIKTSSEFFARKRSNIKSPAQNAKELLNLRDWTYAKQKKRNAEREAAL